MNAATADMLVTLVTKWLLSLQALCRTVFVNPLQDLTLPIVLRHLFVLPPGFQSKADFILLL